MLRKESTLFFTISLVSMGLLALYSRVLHSKSTSIIARVNTLVPSLQSGGLVAEQFYTEKLSDPGSNSTQCKISRTKPRADKTKTVLEYINKIQNCPCNVNFKSETNLLCATTKTLESVYEGSKLEFVPETMTPCFLMDRNGGNYYISNTSDPVNRRKRFLENSTNTLLGCMPSLFLLGIGKTATSQLHGILIQHQRIRGSLRKEMTFWTGGGSHEKLMFFDDNGNSRYNLFAYVYLSNEVSLTIFDNVRQTLQMNTSSYSNENTVLDNTLLLDSSNTNYQMEHLQQLHKYIPDPRVIFSMRDPVEREFSKFRYSVQIEHLRNKPFIGDQTPEGFHRYVLHVLSLPREQQFLQCNYSFHVQNVLQVFPRDKVGFFRFEDFVQDSVGTLERDILPVFGVEPFDKKARKRIGQVQKFNRAVLVYSMLNTTRELLRNHFRESNHIVSMLLNDTKWTWGY